MHQRLCLDICGRTGSERKRKQHNLNFNDADSNPQFLCQFDTRIGKRLNTRKKSDYIQVYKRQLNTPPIGLPNYIATPLSHIPFPFFLNFTLFT
ncbi:hypothetical protein QL285_027085 [Trifolium repens]|nr:hypothetical protein QL285_027085 [Trifolium repens]